MLHGKSIPDPDSLSPHFHQQQSKTHLIISIFPLCCSIINNVNFSEGCSLEGNVKGNALWQDIPLIHHYAHFHRPFNGLMLPRNQFKRKCKKQLPIQPQKKNTLRGFYAVSRSRCHLKTDNVPSLVFCMFS